MSENQEYDKNLVGRLRIMKDLGMKVNYSELGRYYGIDRHIISKLYRYNGVIKRKGRPKHSKWDAYEEKIREKADLPGAQKKAIYMYFKNTLTVLPGSYSGFADYLRRKGIVMRKSGDPHVLYETAPGVQLQGDWKEDLKFYLKDKSEITFNVFSATLGFSREHIFIYSRGKSEEDFIRCLIECFQKLGGVTEIFKTDNMSAIVSIRGNKKTIHPRIVQFFKDLSVKLELCEVKTPQTIMCTL